MAKTKEYRALVGMNYPHPDSTEENVLEEVRVEAGDKISILPDDKWVSKMENQGHIEVWKERQTENVVDATEGVEYVHGVKVRHEDNQIVIREVKVDD